MEEVNLFLVCAIAFAAVMLLLGFLAGVMSVMTRLLPVAHVDGDSPDAAVLAAIQSVVASRFGGARVVRIEEKP